jgi:hypothetical protein
VAKNSVEFLGYSDGSVEVLFMGTVPDKYRAQIMKSMTGRGMVERLEKRDRTCDMFFFDLASGPVGSKRIITSKKTMDIGTSPAAPLNKPSDWNKHKPIPKATPKHLPTPLRNEDTMAQQLANLLVNKSMLGQQPPKQPTDQELFGHLVPSEDQIAKAEDKWSNGMNEFFKEVTKPLPGGKDGWGISKEAEEYWDSIKINIDDKD